MSWPRHQISPLPVFRHIPRRRCGEALHLGEGSAAVRGGVTAGAGVQGERRGAMDSGNRWIRSPAAVSRRSAFAGSPRPRRVPGSPRHGCTRSPPGASPDAGSRCASAAGWPASDGGEAWPAGLPARMRCRRRGRSRVEVRAFRAARSPAVLLRRPARAGHRFLALAPPSSSAALRIALSTSGPGYRRLDSANRASLR